MKRLGLLIVVGLFIAGGCGKPGETTVVGADGSRVTASKDGTSFSGVDGQGNKVDVKATDSSLKGTVTGPDGKTTSYDMGQVTLTENDLGIPFYPGSTKRPQDMDTKTTVDGKTFYTALRFTTDDVKKVAAFYQGKVKSLAESSTTASMSGENAKVTFAINVSPTDGGTTIAYTGSTK